MRPAPLLRFAAAAVTAASLLLSTGGAFAAAWPSRTIKLIVPFPPGGAADATARIYADKLGEALQQTVVIENKPGAGTAIAADYVAHAEPDGYTLSLAPTGQLAILPHINKEITYDPFTSFVPVSNLAAVAYVLAASPDAPFASARELIAAARTAPGKFTYSSCGPGTLCHLSGELFEGQTGTELLHVPFKGSAQAVNALLGNVVNLSFDTVTVLAPQIRDGKVKGLLVTSRERSPQLPDVPTAAEAGVADYVIDSWFGLVAPKGTPPEIVARLNAEVVRIGALPDVRARLEAQGLSVTTSTPDAFAATIRADYDRWGKVVRNAGIKAF
ncbi:Bug family tripartite tricarboxylate transporter substrate binding protein [Rhodopseudomonas sp. P2A-2r]|uniref:Bug family tripartite tricarboxylate transporter substrate binding protein n=1 Tax=unclassified Rhodopseudomonas TaxID=2638247 RepID=UPI002234A9AA|nr:tripartite tricarboxylate transporter substrate binding protein [Rhodopseudomonas sp. P2A-2r]UZE50721.1 tripartite tricarboxylate transporter substrate binding protein [Rhodopseudomonas sp. P2A-2r]